MPTAKWQPTIDHLVEKLRGIESFWRPIDEALKQAEAEVEDDLQGPLGQTPDDRVAEFRREFKAAVTQLAAAEPANRTWEVTIRQIEIRGVQRRTQ